MRFTEEEQSIKTYAVGIALGSLTALLIAILLLLAAAGAVIMGLIGQESAGAVTILACLVGSFFGGVFAIRKIKARALIVGALTGVGMFLLLLLIGFIFYFSIAPQNGLALLAAGAGGGILAGLFRAGRKKRRA